MKFDAIQIHSAPEALVKQIIEQIKTGELKPGQCLPSQRALASMFKVGLGTVREALKILHVMGCVVVMRGKGTFVAKDALTIQNKPPTIENALKAVSLAELLKAREIMEGGSAKMAAERADRESIRRLNEIADKMLSFDIRGEAYYRIDAGFHIAIAEASENKVILELVKLLVEETHRHVHFMDSALGMDLPDAIGPYAESAKKVVECIESRDADRAGQMMVTHLKLFNDNFLKMFSKKQV